MELWAAIERFFVENSPLSWWLLTFFVGGVATVALQGFLRARKIQPNGFQWKKFRDEIFFAIINLTTAAIVLGWVNTTLRTNGIIAIDSSPVSWWVIAVEYVVAFFAFDAYFYWFHRLMHVEPIYTWVHKIHHRSTSPNLLTTLSVGPLESLVNGGFTPLFCTLFTLHAPTVLLLAPTNVIMGLYVHSGYEFFPRWWNRSWATKWFITATFHDLHHKHFRGNFGGYTTIWDWLCGTVRSNYLSEFDKVKARTAVPLPAAAASGDPA